MSQRLERARARARRDERSRSYRARTNGRAALRALIEEAKRDPLLLGILLNAISDEHAFIRQPGGGWRYEVNGQLVSKGS